ncbi:hypothetical protein KTF61_07905 [Faecalibacterium prausnitzii]|uniref:hypothetical protein n=1 Tax=Faecalibacterium prausnitzii TaxID=853 RepID=UPI001C269577|nr:hypothetical protein [Faecalibacterium prausnitzii]MBU8989509.1 hypothetical protein [Faecalibacterium prausnitzii]
MPVDAFCTQRQAFCTGAGLFLVVLYHTREKIAPSEKPFLGGQFQKNFWGFGASPSKNPPKQPKIGGILGCFPPKQAAAALPVPVFPLWLQCVERNHEKWNEGRF